MVASVKARVVAMRGWRRGEGGGMNVGGGEGGGGGAVHVLTVSMQCWVGGRGVEGVPEGVGRGFWPPSPPGQPR